MPQKSNSELLSDILGTLDAILQAQEQQQAKYTQQVTIEVKNNKDIIALLTSMGSMSNQPGLKNTGTQVEALAKGLTMLSKINEKKIASTAKKIEFLAQKLGDISKKIPQDADKTLQPLTRFVQKFSALLNGQLLETLSHFGPLQAIKAGLGIGLFFRILANTVAKMGPEALAKLTKVMSVKKDQAAALNSIIETVMGIDPKKLKELAKVSAKIDPSGGQNIADFFKPIIAIMPKNKREAETISLGLTKIIEALTKLSIGTVLTLALFGKLVDKKSGENIYNFLNEILKITKDYSVKEINALTDLFKGLSKAVLTLSIAIGVMVLIVSLAKMEDILLALGIITLVTVGLVGLIKWIGSKDAQKEMEAGIKGLETLTKSALLIVGAIGLMTLIVSLFKIEDVLLGLGIVAITITGLVIASKYLSSKDTEETINNGVKNLQKLCISLLIVTAAIGLMTLIVSQNNVSDIILGTVVTMAIIAFLVGMVKWISTIDEKELSTANTTLIVLTGMLLAISLIAAFILPTIGKNIEDAAIGALVVVFIIGLMVFTVKWMTSWDEKQLSQATATLLVLTGMLLAVSLIAAYILPTIGENIEDATLGAIVVMGIIGVMVLMVKWITTFKEKQMKYALWALASMTLMLLAVSLIALYILPDIAEKWDQVLIGGGLVLGIIGIMSLMVYLMGKIKTEEVRNAAISMVIIAAMLAVTSWIVNELIIPIGEQAEEALYGSGIIVGLIGVMGIMIYLLGQMSLETIAKGAAVVAAIGALLWALGELLPNYVELTKLVWDNAKAVALGGLEIVATLGVWGLIFFALGSFVSGPQAAYLAIGATVVAGIAAVLLALGELLPTYMKTAMMMEANAKEIAIGGTEIVATLGVWGLIFAGIGALLFGPQAAVVALGGAAITGIAAVLFALSKMLPSYIKTAALMAQNKQDVLNGSDVIKDTIVKFGLILAAVGAAVLNPFSAAAIAVGSVAILEFSAIMKALSKGIDPLVDVIKKIRENKITSGTISNFQKIFVGNGSGGDGTLMGAITNIVNGMNEVGILASAKAGIIAKNLKPIFDTLATFLDVIQKTASLKYVSEWDENGKPLKYETITPTMFKSAGVAVSTAFGTFLQQLAISLKMLDKPSLEALKALSKGIKPVMESVGTFTNAILSVISAAIPDEWDENGKPTKYRKFTQSEFGLAATTIADSFSTFISTMIPKLAPIQDQAGNLINALKDGIEPLMNAVNTYTDAITGLIYGKEVTFTDLNGKEIKKFMEYNPEKFKQGAENIANCFFDFIDTMYSRFSAQGYTEHKLVESNTFSANRYEDVYHNNVADLINGMSGISAIIDAVSSFIDVIEKVAQKGEKIDLKAQGNKMASLFTDFIDAMNKKLGGEGVEEQLNQTIKNIKVSQKLVKTFNSIIDVMIKGFSKDMSNLTTDFVNSSVVPAVQTLLRITRYIAELNIDGKEIDIRDARKHAKYISQILTYFAKGLKDYAEVSNIEPNYTFISGLVEELEKAYSKSTVNYNQFIIDFARIDKQLQNVMANYNSITNIATSRTLKLARAFEKLDDVLKKKEKERTRILVKLKNNISDIGKELAKVNKAMEQQLQNQRKLDELRSQVNNSSTAQTLSGIFSSNHPAPAPAPARRKGESDADYKKRVQKTQQNNTTDVTQVAIQIGQAVTAALDTWAKKEWRVTITNNGDTSPWLNGSLRMR